MPDDPLREVFNRYPVLTDCRESITKAFQLLQHCYEADGVVYTCGNGGSAADAEHIVGELMKAFSLKRSLPTAEKDLLLDPALASNLEGSLRAMALTGPSSLLSAISNDIHPDMLFAQQVYGYGRPGDVLWALSTSGNSKTVLYALKAARARGMQCLGLTGKEGGAMRELCDICICVPETETFKVQELHLPVYHALCQMLELRFFA